LQHFGPLSGDGLSSGFLDAFVVILLTIARVLVIAALIFVIRISILFGKLRDGLIVNHPGYNAHQNPVVIELVIRGFPQM
jgi:hypothetical protein